MDDFNIEDFEQYLIQGEPDKETLKKYKQKVAINDIITSDKVAIKQKSSDIILDYLKNNDSINSSIAQNITGLSPVGVRKIFAKLVEENVILPSGTNKNRIYKLNKIGK